MAASRMVEVGISEALFVKNFFRVPDVIGHGIFGTFTTRAREELYYNSLSCFGFDVHYF